MTLVDHETGENIINPYITLYSPENKGVALNTHSFRDIQRELLNIHDEAVYVRLQFNEKRRLYIAVATICKQDHPFDWEERTHWTRGVRADGINDAVAIIPLGYLLEDIVRKYFPKSFELFEIERKL